MPRPEWVVLVVGTGTEVGKTWVAAHMARAYRDLGRAVAARKPAQSFEPGEGPTDAEVLAEATGEGPYEVCPKHRWYEVPMAPPMAAETLGRPPFTIADLAAELTFPRRDCVGLVETVGGVRSPLAANGDSVDLARKLGPNAVVLVADAGLGTINAVRLCAAALAGYELVVILNRFDARNQLHEANRRWLAQRDGFRVLTDPGALAIDLH